MVMGGSVTALAKVGRMTKEWMVGWLYIIVGWHRSQAFEGGAEQGYSTCRCMDRYLGYMSIISMVHVSLLWLSIVVLHYIGSSIYTFLGQQGACEPLKGVINTTVDIDMYVHEITLHVQGRV